MHIKNILIGIFFPVSTILKNVYTLWTTGRPTDEPFFVSAIIHYPEETILYKPGFWQIMKCAWMQYVSVLVIFIWVLRTVKSYVFQNQLIMSMKCTPWKKDYWFFNKSDLSFITAFMIQHLLTINCFCILQMHVSWSSCTILNAPFTLVN
jgi:hypothetical protein